MIGRVAVGAGALAAWILLGGCQPSAPSPLQPRPSLAPGPEGAAGKIELVPCGSDDRGHRQCGQLTRRDSTGNDVTLQVVLLADRERDPLAGRDLLVYHPGGPGLSAVQLLDQDPPDVDLARWTVLAWDGTTASTTPGACGPASTAFGTERLVADLARAAQAVGEECRFGFGGPADIGALAAGEELEAIRDALGVARVDFLAISYGTAIAEAYLRAHPASVRRAVLDAPLALEATWPARLEALGGAMAIGAASLADGCLAVRCRALLPPGAPADARLTYAAIRRAVLAAAPLVGSGNLALTATMLDQATLLALRSESAWPAWWDGIDAALGGDGTALWALGEKEYFDLDRAVFYRSLCADIDRPADPAAYGAPDDPLLQAYATALAPCVAFPHRDLPAVSSGVDPARRAGRAAHQLTP
jgi:pimeloyl-ACP methyl ester carboxylesterase